MVANLDSFRLYGFRPFGHILPALNASADRPSGQILGNALLLATRQSRHFPNDSRRYPASTIFGPPARLRRLKRTTQHLRGKVLLGVDRLQIIDLLGVGEVRDYRGSQHPRRGVSGGAMDEEALRPA